MNNNGIEKNSIEINNSEVENTDFECEMDNDRDDYLWKLQRRINERNDKKCQS